MARQSDRRGSRSGFVPHYVPFLFLFPALLLLVVFRYYSTLSAIYHYFTIWEIPQPGEFVGLQNYRTLIGDPVFSKSIANSLKFMLGRTCLTLVMAFYRRRTGLQPGQRSPAHLLARALHRPDGDPHRRQPDDLAAGLRGPSGSVE